MTRAELLRSILDIDVQVGELRLKLQDIIDKFTIRGIEDDITDFEKETIANTEE